MLYAYHIGNEIGKAEMQGRGSTAALGWRCRHLKPSELQVLAAVLEAARRWLHTRLKGARARQTVAAFDEGLSPG